MGKLLSYTISIKLLNDAITYYETNIFFFIIPFIKAY